MLDEFEVEPFIKNIIGFLRSDGCALKDKLDKAKETTDEDLIEEIFPFSAEAIEAIKVSVGLEMTPREITLKMTRAAGKAHNYNKIVITSDIID